jgi:hypothetical protein
MSLTIAAVAAEIGFRRRENERHKDFETSILARQCAKKPKVNKW